MNRSRFFLAALFVAAAGVTTSITGCENDTNQPPGPAPTPAGSPGPKPEQRIKTDSSVGFTVRSGGIGFGVGVATDVTNPVPSQVIPAEPVDGWENPYVIIRPGKPALIVVPLDEAVRPRTSPDRWDKGTGYSVLPARPVGKAGVTPGNRLVTDEQGGRWEVPNLPETPDPMGPISGEGRTSPFLLQALKADFDAERQDGTLVLSTWGYNRPDGLVEFYLNTNQNTLLAIWEEANPLDYPGLAFENRALVVGEKENPGFVRSRIVGTREAVAQYLIAAGCYRFSYQPAVGPEVVVELDRGDSEHSKIKVYLGGIPTFVGSPEDAPW